MFGRDSLAEDLAQRLLEADGGAYLVTGFRGVGKTTFVRLVTHLVREQSTRVTGSHHDHFVDIWLNLSKPLSPAQLMHQMIRDLYLRLEQDAILPLIPPRLAEQLKTAFFRTSFEMSSRSLSTDERERSSSIGFQKASLLGLEFLASVGSRHHRSRSDEDLLKYLPYDEKAAEFDLIQFSRELANGFTIHGSWHDKLWRRLRGQATATSNVKILFVLDELDKLDRFYNGSRHPLDDVLEALKTIFSGSNFTYIFIGGQELHERWMRDVALGDSIYESIFSYDLYLPCLWDEQEQLISEFVGGSQPPSLLDEQEARQFALFLKYQGRGIPRRIIREGSKYLHWTRDRTTALSPPQDKKRYVSVVAKLEEILHVAHMTSGLEGTVADKALQDRMRLRMYYVLDWLLWEHGRSFSVEDLNGRIAELNLGNRASSEADLACGLLQLLAARAFIEPMQSTFIGPRDEVGKYRWADWVIRALKSSGREAGDFSTEEAGEQKRTENQSRAEEQGRPKAQPGGRSQSPPADDELTMLGPYKILETVGRGGFAMVYKVAAPTGEIRAAKVLLQSHVNDSVVCERFRREMEILKKIDNPQIVRFYDSGETSEGRPYFIMDLVVGEPLSSILATGPLDLQLVLSIGQQLAGGFAYLHSLGIVRNDIKPANIFVVAGDVRIVDLGTARDLFSANRTITVPGFLIGTIRYMAPEALQDGKADERSDIFSLGVVLYEMTVGYPPFDAPEFVTIIRKIISDDPVLPSRLANVPLELEAILLKTLHKDPGSRFQTMNDLRSALMAVPVKKASKTTGMWLRAATPDMTPRVANRDIGTDAAIVLSELQTLSNKECPEFADLYDPDPLLRRRAIEELGAKDRAVAHILFDLVERICYFTRDAGRPVPVTKNRILLGRDPAADLYIDSQDISRQHVAFTVKSDAIEMEDLASASGVRLNGQVVSRVDVRDGDSLQVGNIQIRIHIFDDSNMFASRQPSSSEALEENASPVQAENAATRYRQELAIAAEFQQRLMTVTVPDVPYAKVNAVSYPCKDIGGDFFDMVYTSGGLSLVIADASGKGVSAAVLASMLRAMVYSQLTRDPSLPEMIAGINRFLCEKLQGQKYATLVVARLEANGALELINCGHVPPLLVSGDTITTLSEGNLPVGLVPDPDFHVTRLQLRSGDRLLLVTDGVTEAEDANGEFFGPARLESCCRGGFAAIEQAVTDFRGDTPLTDDCTIAEMIYRG